MEQQLNGQSYCDDDFCWGRVFSLLLISNLKLLTLF
jgi:hypothetical protein